MFGKKPEVVGHGAAVLAVLERIEAKLTPSESR
jgi:hypothetical protein